MQTITIVEINKQINVPTCWDEIPRRHLLFLFKHMYRLFDGRMSRDEFQLLAACRVLGIKMRRARGLSHIERVTRLDNLGKLADLFSFMFADADGHTTFAYDSLTNRLPRIAGILLGPADGLADITFGEYRAAFEAYARYIDTRDVAHLDVLVSCLYHAELAFLDSTGRNRWKYRPHQTWHRALIENVSLPKKLIILKWFEACDRNIKQGAFEINGERISFAPLFGSGGERTALGTALLDLEYSLADDGLFGGIEGVRSANILDILFRMLRLKERHDKAMEDIKSARK